jgi:DNA-binding transcriptional ArsR family regulator
MWFHDGMDEVFQALANETRRQVVALLRGGGLPASEVAGHFDMTREGVSKHLQVLLRAGLVRVEPQGQQRIYTLEPAALQRIETWLAPFHAFWTQRLDALGTEVHRGRRTSAHDQPATNHRKEA